MRSRLAFVVILAGASLAAWLALSERGPGADFSRAPGSSSAARATGVEETRAAAMPAESVQDLPRRTETPAPARDARFYLAPPEAESLTAWPERPTAALPAPDLIRRSEEVTTVMARSPREAAWLDANAYPTQDELDALDATDAADLAAEAARSDVTAQALLGMKQLRAGDVLSGYFNLQEAAAKGSVWALAILGSDQASRGNLNEAIAWFHVTAYRGDWWTSQLRIMSLPNVTATHAAFGLSYSFQYMRNLDALRARLGLPPFTNEMRPGYPGFGTKPNESVGTYRRNRGR